MMTKIHTPIAILLAAFATTGCARTKDAAKAEQTTLNVTDWTAKTELYMEYPPLVAGKTALFAVHLTQMADFKPVTAGQARVEFTPEESQKGPRAGDVRLIEG